MKPNNRTLTKTKNNRTSTNNIKQNNIKLTNKHGT